MLVRLVKSMLDALLIGLGVLFYHVGLAGSIIRLGGGRPRVLMYHACEESESDFTRGLSINTTPARFSAQLDFLQKYYRIVPLVTLHQEPSPVPAVVITFDDGFRSVYEHAFPRLKARGLPATCYLATDVIANHALIWLNELNWYLHRHRTVAKPLVCQRLGMSPHSSLKRLIEAAIAGYDRGAIVDFLTELRDKTATKPESLAEGTRLYIDRREIEEMSRNRFTFGNHSGSHAVLPRLSQSECREEVGRAKSVLATVPQSIPSLAYPFGRSDEVTRRIARDLGYTTLMNVEGDNSPLDLHQVGRLNVTSCSPAVLFARMELAAPIKFRIKRFFKGLRARFTLRPR
jgi:peptidoglycan/xylan/chitin deacetylase (PgdA/CDA1 family)